MRFLALLVLAAAALGTLPAQARAVEAPVRPKPPQAAIVDPWVSTDRAPDFRTIDRLIKSVVKDGMSNEEKVLAIFHVVSRNFCHWKTSRHLAYDFHRVQHSLGSGACLTMTTPLHVIYERMGFKSKSWVHDGHHMMEVEYDGSRHCLDPHMNFYCYDRSTPRKIASIEQLRADKTLAYNARKEGRAGKSYLLCGDSPRYFAPGGRWRLERDGRWPKMRIDEPFGRIALRRGETYVRTWWPGPHYVKFRDRQGKIVTDRYGCGPVHTCGARADRRDKANWPLYEPHLAKPGVGRMARASAYRLWAVGRLEYKPDLKNGHYRDAVVSVSDIQVVQIGLAQADAAKPGEIVFSVACPYVLTAGEVKLLAPEGKVSASVSVDRGKTWKAVGLAQEEAGVHEGRFVDEINGALNGYRLKLELTEGATLTGLQLVTHFQVNRYSLPHLVPGKNVVRVEAAKYGSPLTVKYEWSEGADWKTPKSASQTFTKDGTFEINVAGPKYPRMKSLTLSVSP